MGPQDYSAHGLDSGEEHVLEEGPGQVPTHGDEVLVVAADGQARKITVKKVDGPKNPADMLTKPQSRKEFADKLWEVGGELRD